MKKSMRKGFTLVELLVCMVVIAILALALIFASKEAVSSARAARIINNLNILKTAAEAWYADHVGLVSSSEFKVLNDYRADIIKNYVSNSDAMEISDRYKFSDASNAVGYGDYQDKTDPNHPKDWKTTDPGGLARDAKMSWYVWYDINGEDGRVLEKLKKRGKSAKLRYTHYENDWEASGGYYTIDNPQTPPRCIGLHIFGENIHKVPK